MSTRKQLSEWLLVLLYGSGAVLLAQVLIRTGWSDAWLYLLVGPVLLAAPFYPRWAYLAMSAGTFFAARAVALHRDPSGGPAMRNIWVAVALMLVTSELLHRMMLGRVRAEDGLRALLEREREARAAALAAQERLAFLASASAALAGSLDLATTLTQVVRRSIPYLGDFCAIRLHSESEELLAAAHTEPAKQALLDELRLKYALDLGLPANRDARLSPELRPGDPATAIDDEHRRLLRELDVRSMIAVPLVRHQEALGELLFGSGAGRRGYEPDDLELAQEIGRRAITAIENARLHQALQEGDRRKVEFLALLAHELRNPLAAIANASYLVEHRLPGGPGSDSGVAVITRQSEHLARLVDDLLEVSRITQGKLELRKEPVEIVAATRAAVESVRSLLDGRSHQLHVSLPNAPIWVELDPTRYEQILVNLLTNAAKYTPEGGQVWVSVELAAGDPACVEVRVRDTGIGIGAELLPRIFELFTQGETTRSGSHTGLGIGLTLVRRLAELHGGSVTASSSGPDQGSEFMLRLPVGAAGPGEGSLDSGEAPLPPRSRRVLVVDDDRDALETIGDVLEMWGHQVWLASDAARGLADAREHQPEIALLDIGMPGMDGYELARRLRAVPETREIVLVALTGYGGAEDRERSRQSGFDHHLTKPADPEELKRLLRSA